ncbi:MAG: hypothetical protein QOH76_2918 [Thermoleophilaceae bacterium]|nr:hypothetical protein [Thermoleophilaceae bacterium]
MTRRLLFIPLLALALLLPSAAEAATQRFDTFGPAGGDGATASPRATLHKAQKALVEGRGDGSEVTLLLKQLALKLPALHGADRKRATQLLARPSRGQGTGDEQEYTTAEQPPLCSAHFCVHWVSTTSDAPPAADQNHNGVRDYVETVSSVFEHVYAVENVDLGWKPPKSDGNRGCIGGATANCAGKTDVYIKEIGNQGIYGYAAPDPGQRSVSQFAYLVVDDDYRATQFPQYEGNPLPPLEVTAAHEYNHVLQFNYDTAQDTWMFEATAVWMEDYVYTDVNDYVQYLSPWSQMSRVPLTYYSGDGNDPLNIKVYGDGVWNRWIEGHYGPDPMRDAWAASRQTTPKSFAPAAYNAALKAKGTSFYASFSRFAADTAEWRAANTPFAEGETFPDVDREISGDTGRPITLTPDGTGAAGRLDHTAYVLLDVRPSQGMPQLKLAVATPRGTRMAIALIGRTGDEVHGTSHEFLKLLPSGGPGLVTIDNPGQYDRLTAAVINSDTAAKRDTSINDWLWRHDSQGISARVSGDFTAPRVTGRRPNPGTHRASLRPPVTVSFNERMYTLNSHTVKLLAPNGRSVKAKVTVTTRGRKSSPLAGANRLVLTPRARLHAHTRYRVRLSRDLRDYGGNALPASALGWSFVTRR